MEYLIAAVCIIVLIVDVIILVHLKKAGGASDYDSLEKKLDEANKKADLLQNEMRFFQNRIEDRINSTNQATGETLRKTANMNYKILLDVKDNITAVLNQVRLESVENYEKMAEKISAAIASLQAGNELKLEQMRATVDEKLNETLSNRLDSSFKAVSLQLENLYKSLGEMKELSTGVTANVSNLNRILSNVKIRGTWAEVQLENILDQTIPNSYVKNFSPGKNSLQRVEFAVKIPSADSSGDIYMPIDSKFPLESYVRLTEAAEKSEPEEIEKERKQLESAVLRQAAEINKYICEPVTTPFAIMYLPIEGLYAELLSSKSGIGEKIQNKYSVILAGPTTITALLSSLAVGFRAVAVNEKANEVREILAATKAQYGKFSLLLEKAGRKIEEAAKTIDDAKKRSDLINTKLKEVSEIKQSSPDILPESED